MKNHYYRHRNDEKKKASSIFFPALHSSENLHRPMPDDVVEKWRSGEKAKKEARQMMSSARALLGYTRLCRPHPHAQNEKKANLYKRECCRRLNQRYHCIRSKLYQINQLLMCVNKILSTATYATEAPSIVKVEPYTISSSENSRTSFDDNDTIAFGPIKVKRRKKPAPTLATGRRSKYEILSPEEEQKRNIRRARNRAAAERVRVSRLSVEQQLLNQIAELESQEAKLSQNVQSLQHQKLHLETRLFTHERMCSNMTQTSASIASNTDLAAIFQFDDIQFSSQQFDTIVNDKTIDIDFESFIDSLTPEQIQQTFPDSFINFTSGDDLNDFLMN